MNQDTRLKFTEMCKIISLGNNIDNTSEQFAVIPAVQQQWEQHLQEQYPFLKKISSIQIRPQEFAGLSLDTDRLIAGRINTDTNERTPIYPIKLSERRIRVEQTNFDTAISYADIDSWANMSNFQEKYRNQIARSIARSRIVIGWHGTSAASTTDIASNKLLQDV